MAHLLTEIQKSSLGDFTLLFNKLRDFPEKALIEQLTSYAKANISVAQFISNIVIAKTVDPETAVSYKLPIFYLLDSIMKVVGGPYPLLFGKYMAEAFNRTFDEVTDREKGKLDVLLGTWEERKLLSLDILARMREHTRNRIINNSSLSSSSINNNPPLPPPVLKYPPTSTHILLTKPPPHTYQSTPTNSQQTNTNQSNYYQSQPPNLIPQRQPQIQTRRDTPRIGINGGHFQANSQQVTYNEARKKPKYENQQTIEQQNQPIIQEIIPIPTPLMILTEMKNILTQMYSEMGVKDGLSLEKLEVINQPLFLEMKKTAEFKCIETMKNNLIASTSSVKTPQVIIAPASYVPAFICEVPIAVDINRSKLLCKRLEMSSSSELNSIIQHETNNQISPVSVANLNNIIISSIKIMKKLNNLVDNAYIPPIIPNILQLPLPLEPSKDYIESLTGVLVNKKQHIDHSSFQKIPTPVFRIDELNRRPDIAVKQLYGDREFQYVEDGLRFKTLAELVKHTDERLTIKELQRREEMSQKRSFRKWYCKATDWISDFNALDNKEGDDNKLDSNSININQSEVEEFIVPADELFTRCPISKEVFDTVWDEDEGEFMYRNAIKILVTDNTSSNKSIFKLSKPIGQLGIHIGYLIVHKLLVLDDWLKTGKAVSLKNALIKYETIDVNEEISIDKRSEKRNDFMNLLKKAAGEDEDEDDIFVILDTIIM